MAAPIGWHSCRQAPATQLPTRVVNLLTHLRRVPQTGSSSPRRAPKVLRGKRERKVHKVFRDLSDSLPRMPQLPPSRIPSPWIKPLQGTSSSAATVTRLNSPTVPVLSLGE